MKKRFLSALLAVAVFASLMMGISHKASAARKIIIDDLGSPKTRYEMETRLSETTTRTCRRECRRKATPLSNSNSR